MAVSVQVENICKNFGNTCALNNLSASIPSSCVVTLVGPDSAGKTTFLRLLAGLMSPTKGKIEILSLDRQDKKNDFSFISYMPQKFGLYEDLSVLENLNLYADIKNVHKEKRKKEFDRLLSFTSLAPFTSRLAGKLSGGMKQKLGLACALLGDPKLLLLDEPGVGVDPISRRELWDMVQELSQNISVIWATAYMDEAEKSDYVLMLSEGKLLYEGRPQEWIKELKNRTYYDLYSKNKMKGVNLNTWIKQTVDTWIKHEDTLDVLVQGSKIRILFKEYASIPSGLVQAKANLEDAYMDCIGGIDKNPSIYLHPAFDMTNNTTDSEESFAVKADTLTKMYGSFAAAKDISFSVSKGEIFGLLGPNGAGKSTTFKMLCGLSSPSSGFCSIHNISVTREPEKARSSLGYMAQKFSLYGDLTVQQNIDFIAHLYTIEAKISAQRAELLLKALDLEKYKNSPTHALPLGYKQRLSLLCATLHNPKVLFLDEPTSGVDTRTRREFWKHIQALTTRNVAVIVTTHFMEEAEYCDEIVLISQGRIIAKGAPDDIKRAKTSKSLQDPTLEDAFIAYLEEEESGENTRDKQSLVVSTPQEKEEQENKDKAHTHDFLSTNTYLLWWSMLFALIKKEGKQVLRDPSSYIVAFILPFIFLLFFGYAISLDTGIIKLSVLSEEQGEYSQSLILELYQSPNFNIEVLSHREEAYSLINQGKSSALLVLSEDFEKNILRQEPIPLQLIIDATEPNNAQQVELFTQSIVTSWFNRIKNDNLIHIQSPLNVESITWYNNTANSRWALVPGSITVIMTMIGTLLTSLVITREWERGTMEMLFASPVSRAQIFISKFIPYYLLAMLSLFLCTFAGVYLFEVPFRGSILALLLLSTAFLLPALGQGLLISSVFKSQFPAAMLGFLTGLLPALILSGLLFDINSMSPFIRWVTNLIPAKYFLVVSQTAFLTGDIWELYIPAICYMSCLGMLFLLLAYRNIKKNLDE